MIAPIFNIKNVALWQRRLAWSLAILLVSLLVWQWSQRLADFDWGLWLRVWQHGRSWTVLAVVLALMPFNWLLEARKFQMLLRLWFDCPFARAWQAVVYGIGAGSLTPNRLGEFGGRLIGSKRWERKAILTATLLGSLAQWAAFGLMAWPALVWISGPWLPHSWQAWRWGLLPIGPGLVFLAGYLLPDYCRPGSKAPLARWWRRWSGFFRLSQVGTSRSKASKQAERSIAWQAVGLAGLRLWLYSTQLYLLLGLLGPQLPYGYAMAAIWSVYLLQAGLPLPPGMHLLLRAELIALLLGGGAEATAAGLGAFGLLYLINILLPSLLTPVLLLKQTRMI